MVDLESVTKATGVVKGNPSLTIGAEAVVTGMVMVETAPDPTEITIRTREDQSRWIAGEVTNAMEGHP